MLAYLANAKIEKEDKRRNRVGAGPTLRQRFTLLLPSEPQVPRK